MELGIQIPNFSYPGGEEYIAATLKEIIRTIDMGEFHSLWVMDHYFQIENLFGLSYKEPMLEGYSALNYFAGLTSKVKLGTLVSGVIYRNPGFLIKQVSTLDVLSQGRAYFGIGAGWYQKEAEAYGYKFPSTKIRFEMLEEILQIAKQLWSDNDGEFKGKHYNLNETLSSPKTIQQPTPKIMIGGMGEKKTLRMVAQYADTTNLFARVGVEVLENKLKVLKKHCDVLGRNYDDIEKTSLGTVELMEGKQTPDDVIKQFTELSKVGIEHAIVNLPNIFEITPIEMLRDEILPAIKDL